SNDPTRGRNAGRRRGRSARSSSTIGRMGGMRRSDLDPDPLRQFTAWLEEARAGDVHAPVIMTLATASRDGRPSARQVLMKSFDEAGYTFFTGYGSRKAGDL